MTSVSVQMLAEAGGAELRGDVNASVGGVSDIERARIGDLIFVEHANDVDRAMQSCASAIVLAPPAPDAAQGKALLVADEPRLAFSRMAALLLGGSGRVVPGIHPAASVDPAAVVDPAAEICRDAVVEAGVRVGPGTRVGVRVTLERDVTVGRDCDLCPNVVVHAGTTIGDRVSVHSGSVLGGRGFAFVCDRKTGRHERFPQVGSLVIGDDVEIGANVTIDRGAFRETVIGSGTKIDNLVHIAHNVKVGCNSIIVAQVGIAGSSEIGDSVVLAGQVGVADHVRIESGVQVGAQAGVPTGKVLRGAGQVFWGTPARPIRAVMKELAAMARLIKR